MNTENFKLDSVKVENCLSSDINWDSYSDKFTIMVNQSKITVINFAFSYLKFNDTDIIDELDILIIPDECNGSFIITVKQKVPRSNVNDILNHYYMELMNLLDNVFKKRFNKYSRFSKCIYFINDKSVRINNELIVRSINDINNDMGNFSRILVNREIVISKYIENEFLELYDKFYISPKFVISNEF